MRWCQRKGTDRQSVIEGWVGSLDPMGLMDLKVMT
jgi:hypothetical protein